MTVAFIDSSVVCVVAFDSDVVFGFCVVVVVLEVVDGVVDFVVVVVVVGISIEHFNRIASTVSLERLFLSVWLMNNS